MIELSVYLFAYKGP